MNDLVPVFDIAVPVSGPPGLRTGDTSRGTNQSGVRLYNERLILSLIRRAGQLPKSEIARVTGLSAQTATGIVKRLEADGLLLPMEPQRGRVGQPTVPFALNPDGAFSLGLKIGRRSCELVLVDFIGTVRQRWHRAWTYPTPEQLISFTQSHIHQLASSLDDAIRSRIVGLGIAAPFELWNWESEVGAPHDMMEQWRAFDIQKSVEAICPWPVTFCNDATSACAAEIFFGQGWRQTDLVYFFIGSFIGGGIFLNGSLYPGRTGNAGALGSMPVNLPGMHEPQQLIQSASIYALVDALKTLGIDPSSIWETPLQWPDFGPSLDEWIDRSARGLAIAAVSALALIDFEAIVIDGAFPLDIRARIVNRTREEIDRLDCRGLSPFIVREGSIGPDARSKGAAALPFLASFARDREVLFKESQDAERN